MWESDGEDGRGLPQAKPWDPQFGGLPIGSISELQGSSALKGQAQPENLLLIPSPTLPGAQVGAVEYVSLPLGQPQSQPAALPQPSPAEAASEKVAAPYHSAAACLQHPP